MVSLLVSSNSFAKTFIELDISAFKVKEINIKKAAIRAFLTRSWKIQKVSETEVVGDHGAIAAIRFNKLPKIWIGFTDDEKEDEDEDEDEFYNTKWLYNLKKDFLVEIIKCSPFER